MATKLQVVKLVALGVQRSYAKDMSDEEADFNIRRLTKQIKTGRGANPGKGTEAGDTDDEGEEGNEADAMLADVPNSGTTGLPLGEDGFDAEGYDEDGYAKDGVNREGYDEKGRYRGDPENEVKAKDDGPFDLSKPEDWPTKHVGVGLQPALNRQGEAVWTLVTVFRSARGQPIGVLYPDGTRALDGGANSLRTASEVGLPVSTGATAQLADASGPRKNAPRKQEISLHGDGAEPLFIGKIVNTGHNQGVMYEYVAKDSRYGPTKTRPMEEVNEKLGGIKHAVADLGIGKSLVTHLPPPTLATKDTVKQSIVDTNPPAGEGEGDTMDTPAPKGKMDRTKNRMGVGSQALTDLARGNAAADPVMKKAVDDALASNDRLRAAVFQIIMGNKQRLGESLGIPEQFRTFADGAIKDLEAAFAEYEKGLEAWKAATEAKMVQTIRFDIRNHEPIEVKGQHNRFPLLMKNALLRKPTMLVGPSGSGKSTAAKVLAENLGLPFSYMALGPTQTESKLSGYTNAEGYFIPTEFYLRYRYGGVMLLDEMDASEASVLIWINNAIQSRTASFPRGFMTSLEMGFNGNADHDAEGEVPAAGGMVDMHPDCIIVASANTFGRGADMVYQGRNALDGSTLKRFLVLKWEYDEAMERRLAGNDVWVDLVQGVRAVVADLRMEHIVSPVDSINGAHLLAAGVGVADVLDMTVFAGLLEQDQKRIREHAGWGKVASGANTLSPGGALARLVHMQKQGEGVN